MNIAMVVLDDWPQSMIPPPLGWSVNPLARAPNLLAIAGSGRFTGIRTGAACSPTRAQLITGLDAVHNGIGEVLDEFDPTDELDRSLPSIARIMENSGVAALAVGKWHLGTPSTRHPLDMGFRRFSGTEQNVDDYWNALWFEDDVPSIAPGYVLSHSWKRARDLVDEVPQGTPWFLLWNLHAPHQPFHVPPARLYSSQDNPCVDDRQKYLAAAEAADTVIGQFLHSLTPAERSETLVVILSDNGAPKDVEEPDLPKGHGKGTMGEGGCRGWVAAHQLGARFSPSFDRCMFTAYELPSLLMEYLATGQCELTHPAGAVPRVTRAQRYKPNGPPPVDPATCSLFHAAAVLEPWKLRVEDGVESWWTVDGRFGETEIQEADVPPDVVVALRAAI